MSLKVTPFFQRKVPVAQTEQSESLLSSKSRVQIQSGAPKEERDEVLKIWDSLDTKTRIDLGNSLPINCLSAIFNDEKVRNYLKEHYPLKPKPILKRRNT